VWVCMAKTEQTNAASLALCGSKEKFKINVLCMILFCSLESPCLLFYALTYISICFLFLTRVVYVLIFHDLYIQT
jgi:hypothetical protein